MAIQLTDSFIASRGNDNYKVAAQQVQDFLQPFEEGTIMVFYQSSPPTGWKNLNIEFTIPRLYNGAWSGDAHVVSGRMNFQSALANRRVPIPSHSHGASRGTHNHGGGNAGHNHGGTESNHTHSSSGGNHLHEYYIGGQYNAPQDDIWTRDDKIDTSIPKHNWGKASGGSASLNTGGATGFSFSNHGAITLSCSSTSAGISVSSAGGDSRINWEVKYCDVILCEKLPNY